MKFGRAELPLNWKFIAAFVIYLLIVLLLGFMNWRIQRANLIGLAKERISSISNYKASEIANWVKERTRDAKVLSLTGNFHREMLSLIQKPSDTSRYNHVISHFIPMVEHYGYEDILLSDMHGRIFASVRLRSDSLGNDSRKMLCNSVDLGNGSFSSLYNCEQHNSVHIDFYTPVLKDPSDSGSVVAMVLLRMNPEHFLYPLIQAWPVSSRTSETLLVEAMNDSVVFMNRLRHIQNSPLSYRVSFSKKLPATLVVRGYSGLVEANDYRGAEVLAYTRPVEGTPWFMVSKTDMEEILEPMSGWQFRTGFGLIILILLGVLGLYLIAVQRRKDHYSRMYLLESQRLALVKHYELVLKRANDIILLLDASGTVTDCNEKAIREYGYAREELVGQNASMVIAPESQDRYFQFLEKEPSEEGYLFEAVHRRKDGSTFPVEISSMVIDIEGKKFIHGIIRDISERIEYQHTIIRERNTAQNYLDITGSIIVVLNSAGNVSLINQKGLALLEYQRDDVIGKNWFDHYIPVNIRGIIKEVFSKLINEEIESPEFFENTVITASGQEKIIFWHNALIRDDAGKVTGTISSGEDITILRKKELELEKLNQELEERVKKRTEQLETANKDLESFSYSVSHDLRAPLRSIDGFSLALLEDQTSKLDEKGKDYLHRIRKASQRMALLIDELLRLSRITRQEVVFQQIDLSRMAHEICDEFLDQETKKKITLQIAGGISVKADPGLMRIALSNLFQNAFKFSAQVEHPEVLFDLVDHNGETALMIRDNGAGFDMRYAGKLFGVFQRLHTPQEFEGTGIGLTIVQRIVHRHGGTISATGEPGKGASFYIHLPELTKNM